MCDTMVALGNATADGSVILAKNSDREPNEAHVLMHVPHAHHEPGTQVRCTYATLPQVRETYEVLLCKPFWLWGCEMGVNEKGVAIGNEAVFTKEPYAETGLLGMDLMRLALERADTAEDALHLITELLMRHGQGGASGYLHKGTRYHNAFIIADPHDAWVIETAGKYWAAERVRDVRSISNRLTIHSEYDLCSPGLVEHAIAKGWCRARDDFDFARCYSDRLYTHFGRGMERQCRTTDLMRASMGDITAQTMMSILRDHGAAASDVTFSPAKSSMRSVCMHAGNELLRYSQSTGSMVSCLGRDEQVHWVTGTSAPCTSVFKPVYLNGLQLAEHGAEANGFYDCDSLWWLHERLHRAMLCDYAATYPLIAEERDALELGFLRGAAQLSSDLPPLGERRAMLQRSFSQACFDEALVTEQRWFERIQGAVSGQYAPWLYRRYWTKHNKHARLPMGQQPSASNSPHAGDTSRAQEHGED